MQSPAGPQAGISASQALDRLSRAAPVQHDSRIVMGLCMIIIGPSPKSLRYRCVALHCTPTKTIRIEEIRVCNEVS